MIAERNKQAIITGTHFTTDFIFYSHSRLLQFEFLNSYILTLKRSKVSAAGDCIDWRAVDLRVLAVFRSGGKST